MLRLATSVIAVALGAGAAQGALFSFASNFNDQAWMFRGGPGLSFSDGTGPNDPTVLVIDDNNGPLAPLLVSCQFNANVNLTTVGSFPLGGGQFSHNYHASGSFNFVDIASGVTLLTVDFSAALYTSLGGEFTWGSTGAFQASLAAGSNVTMTWGGAPLPAYGLTPGPLGSGDFAFGLDAVNTSGVIPFNFQNLGVGITPATGSTTQAWFAEASFTASVVPVPGTALLLALGAGMVVRRRR